MKNLAISLIKTFPKKWFSTSTSYKVGDRVVYNPIQQRFDRITIGTITEILAETKRFDTDPPVTIKASAYDPKYIIKNSNTGKLTAYKIFNIRRLAKDHELTYKDLPRIPSDTIPEDTIGKEPPHFGVSITK